MLDEFNQLSFVGQLITVTAGSPYRFGADLLVLFIRCDIVCSQFNWNSIDNFRQSAEKFAKISCQMVVSELAGRIGLVCKWSASVLPNCESLSCPKRSSFQSRITGQKRLSVRCSELKRSISGRAHLAGKLWQMVSAPSLLHLRSWTLHRYCHPCHRRQQHKKKTIRE